MKRITTWSPDTCGCIIDLEWDDEQPEESRIHTPIRIKKCNIHVGQPDIVSAHSVVLDENTRKNIVFGMAQGIKPSLKLEDYRWRFDTQRQLRLTLSTMTKTQRTKLQDEADKRFGSSKVFVA